MFVGKQKGEECYRGTDINLHRVEIKVTPDVFCSEGCGLDLTVDFVLTAVYFSKKFHCQLCYLSVLHFSLIINSVSNVIRPQMAGGAEL